MVYTPTEGDAIQRFSELFRRPEGCFLNIQDQERVEHDIAAWGHADDIDYIVVTGPPPFLRALFSSAQKKLQVLIFLIKI